MGDTGLRVVRREGLLTRSRNFLHNATLCLRRLEGQQGFCADRLRRGKTPPPSTPSSLWYRCCRAASSRGRRPRWHRVAAALLHRRALVTVPVCPPARGMPTSRHCRVAATVVLPGRVVAGPATFGAVARTRRSVCSGPPLRLSAGYRRARVPGTALPLPAQRSGLPARDPQPCTGIIHPSAGTDSCHRQRADACRDRTTVQPTNCRLARRGQWLAAAIRRRPSRRTMARTRP
jgi:hypothetical protein